MPKKWLNRKNATKKASALLHYLASQRALPVYKGTLAYLLGFVLLFLRDFDNLNRFPATFTSMTILLIIGSPGKSVGACIQATFLSLFGVGLGSIGFVILAKLVHAPVAQGFVFAAIVYLFALVKAQGLKWFALALLGILMSFNGIYTSILVGRFDPAYLQEFIKVYCWAAAIVLFVNIVILPVTSEKELRRTLILSLEHIATLSHLLAKGYTLELTEEEREARAQLAQSIRADFGFLTQKIEETSIEINISRFSMEDYQGFVARTRGMQLALITVYSTLVGFEKRDLELFKTKFLPNTIKSFNLLRASLNTTMHEISEELGCKPMVIPAAQPGYAEYMDKDVEKQRPEERPSRSTSFSMVLGRQQTRESSGEGDSVDERLQSVAKKLRDELKNEEGDEEEDSDEMLQSEKPEALDNDEKTDENEGENKGKPARPSLKLSEGPSIASAPSTGATTPFALGRQSSRADAEGTYGTASPTAAQTSPNVGTAKQSQSPSAKRKECPPGPKDKQGRCIRSLRHVFDKFAADQHAILSRALSSGKLHGSDDSLRISEPMPSLRDTYNYRYVPSSAVEAEGQVRRRTRKRRRRHWMDVEGVEGSYPESGIQTPVATPVSTRGKDDFYEILREKSEKEQRSDEVSTASHHSLTRVYSFVFALEQFVNELEQLYYACKKKSKRRLHVHIYESLHRPHAKPPPNVHSNPVNPVPPPILPTTNPAIKPAQSTSQPVADDPPDLSVSEALALLEHRPYTPPKQNIWQRLERAEHWLRSPTSVFAAKTACAATIFAVLILHPVPRPWFISFGMTSGALTIVTALTPTLGQSVLAFLFQILGSGFGYLWALTILEMFRDVGGYHFNPYGITCMLVPYALIMVYILYEKPQFFVAALLALNGTGTVLVLEWINVEYLGNVHYDTPVLRFAKAFATLGIALGLAGTFQLFILRNPARRTLRKRLGAMLFAQLSYVTLLQAYVRGAMPSDSSRRVPDAALVRVERELRHREMKIQAELISLRPLVAFAAAEPQLSRPFRADIINQMLRTSQIILDRMRESRTAIGTKPLPDVVSVNFIRVLAPYRRRNTQILQLALFLIASSVTAKSPLPRETPAELENAGQTANLMHDILVLASRHTRTQEGMDTIRSGDFTRYFHYLVCITSIAEHIKALEDACKDLFGELEDKLA